MKRWKGSQYHPIVGLIASGSLSLRVGEEWKDIQKKKNSIHCWPTTNNLELQLIAGEEERNDKDIKKSKYC